MFRKEVKVTLCKDKAPALAFLRTVDGDFPVPLSQKADLEDLAQKVIDRGYIVAVQEGERLLSAAFFYCNDVETEIGYLSVLATLPECRGMGYANAVISEMERIAKEQGMRRMQLYTYRSNKGAVDFYIKNGYRIAEGEERLRLVKEL